jgi:hypothetical protein
LGITFTEATILIAGDSLNELEFPPKSGANVVFDDSGPMNIFFSAPVQQVEACFTYATPLTLSFFNSSNASIGNISSMFSSNMALSGNSGSSPNELLGLIYLPGIARLSITGDLSGTSFVMDDLTTTPVLKTAPVPEFATILLLGGGIAGLTALQLKKSGRFA